MPKYRHTNLVRFIGHSQRVDTYRLYTSPYLGYTCRDLGRIEQAKVGREKDELKTEHRQMKMAALRRGGKTLTYIGAVVHLSRERVRQLLAEAGVETMKPCAHCGADIQISNKSGRCGSCRYVARTPAERFATFVSPPDEQGHQFWTGFINRVTGYAVFSWRGQHVTAHSAALMIRDGLTEPPPETPVACHRINCMERRDCVALAHIAWGTQEENVNGSVAKGLAPRRQRVFGPRITHCRRANHEYTAENTYSPPSGGRHCKQCVSDRGKDRYYRLKRERLAMYEEED